MRADSVHGYIGNKMKKRKEVLDWNDLDDVVTSSSRHTKVIHLKHTEVYKFSDLHKKSLNRKVLPRLELIKVVQFRKGSSKLYFKRNHEEREFQAEEFLQHKYRRLDAGDHFFPTTLTQPRGVNKVKKDAILKQLVPHMSCRKAAFWSDLPAEDNCVDLCCSRDDGE